MTLVDRLRAAIDADEQWAKAASFPERGGPPVDGGVHWVWGVGDNWDPCQPDPLEEFLGQNADDSGGVVLVTREQRQLDWGGPGNTLPAVHVASVEEIRTVDAAHIVRHDPARVLAMVQAHREILDEILPEIEGTESALDQMAGLPGAHPSIEASQRLVIALAKAYGIEVDA